MTRSIERPVQLTVAGREVSLGDGRPFFLSGPCVLQERGLTLEIATALDEIFRSRNVPFVFKASFDKANRSSLGSGRGPGLEEGLEWLAEVRESLSVPIVTDVHEPAQCARVAEVVEPVRAVLLPPGQLAGQPAPPAVRVRGQGHAGELTEGVPGGAPDHHLGVGEPADQGLDVLTSTGPTEAGRGLVAGEGPRVLQVRGDAVRDAGRRAGRLAVQHEVQPVEDGRVVVGQHLQEAGEAPRGELRVGPARDAVDDGDGQGCGRRAVEVLQLGLGVEAEGAQGAEARTEGLGGRRGGGRRELARPGHDPHEAPEGRRPASALQHLEDDGQRVRAGLHRQLRLREHGLHELRDLTDLDLEPLQRAPLERRMAGRLERRVEAVEPAIDLRGARLEQEHRERGGVHGLGAGGA